MTLFKDAFELHLGHGRAKVGSSARAMFCRVKERERGVVQGQEYSRAVPYATLNATLWKRGQEKRSRTSSILAIIKRSSF